MVTLKKLPVIFFDGDCGLCHSFVQFVIQHDKNNIFYFSSLNSSFVQKIFQSNENLQKYQNIDSIFYLDEQQNIFYYSTASLKIIQKLDSFRFLYFLILLPTFIRDFCYKFIAKNRKNFFKEKKCLILNSKLKKRFLL